MKGNMAGVLFLGICLILVIPLITKTIGYLTGGSIFAIALVLLGGFSRGFKK